MLQRVLMCMAWALARDTIRQQMRARPDLTTTELLEVVEQELQRATAVAGPADEGRCRDCGRPIVLPEEDGPWFHLAADGSLTRGCRSASFSPEQAWDEGVHPSRRGTPNLAVRTPPDEASPGTDHSPF
jgi:hypothetical protein